ncbi:MAG: transporter [Edaphobacter sp.]|nr:transporter [Edaphobacter sp.]
MMEVRDSKFDDPWRVLLLLSLAFVLNYMDRQIVFTIFPLLRHDLGFTNLQLGLAGSLFTWTYSLCMPLAGRLSDIWPRQRLVIAAVVMWSTATLGTSLSHTAVQFLCWRVIMGFSESLYVPAAIGMITTAHPGPTRSRALSVHGFAQFTGITLGAWYGGWAAERFNWRWGFGFIAIVGILYAGFLGTQFRNFQTASVSRGQGVARDLFRSRCYIALCTAFLLFCSMLWMLYAWLPNHIFETFHLSLSQSGLDATLYLQASSAVGVLLGGLLGDKSSRRNKNGRFNIVATGLFLSAPFAAAIFGATSLPLLEISACGFGIFSGCVAGNVFATLPDIVAHKNFGLATGLLNLAGGLGAGAAIFLTGFLHHSFTNARLMKIGSGLAMSAAVVLFLTVRSYFDLERTGLDTSLT